MLESIEGDPKGGLAASLDHYATAAGRRRLPCSVLGEHWDESTSLSSTAACCCVPTALCLQVLESIEGDPKGGLAASLDHCATAAGRRRLRAWLCQPLTSIDAISDRQDAVEDLMERIPDAAGAARKRFAGACLSGASSAAPRHLAGPAAVTCPGAARDSRVAARAARQRSSGAAGAADLHLQQIGRMAVSAADQRQRYQVSLGSSRGIAGAAGTARERFAGVNADNPCLQIASLSLCQPLEATVIAWQAAVLAASTSQAALLAV